MTSGAQSYFAIIHIPIRAYRGQDEDMYTERMLEYLEKGVAKANEVHYRRTVICVDGLSSGDRTKPRRLLWGS